jgi:hypothetical protein
MPWAGRIAVPLQSGKSGTIFFMRDPRKQHRIDQLEAQRARSARYAARLRQLESRYPWIRLGVALLGVVGVYLAFRRLPFPWGWASLPVALAAFLAAARLHQQVIDALARIEAQERITAARWARAGLDWQHIPAAPPFPQGPEHPFALDLNLPSLHRLLDSSASQGGSLRLAHWLADPLPDAQKISARHALVDELLARPAFRARLLLDGAVIRKTLDERWDGEGILRWLDERPSTASLLPFLIAAGVLAGANLVLFGLSAAGLLPPLWVGSLAAYLLLQSARYRETSAAFEEAYALASLLERFRQVMVNLETSPYPRGSRLEQLCAVYRSADRRPSRALRQIGRIVSAASVRYNPFLTLPLNLLVPWDLFFTYQLERYRVRLREVMPAWLDAWYELEALASLAEFSDLNPETTRPVLDPPAGPVFPAPQTGPVFTARRAGPVFKAQQIAHPLIPDGPRVANDFQVDRLGELAVITGSNMSGKSTFLRTLGINLALAYAGGSVLAERLEAPLMRLYTSMTLNDSLEGGISFFYAEVRRLKGLLDALQDPDAPMPLFFLIDEIFRGTNNRERQAGSQAYTAALVGRSGLGLISTHDLELAHLAETLPGVRNLHFREDVQGQEMVFDYILRPGPSPTTNALRIMKMAGLPVP